MKRVDEMEIKAFILKYEKEFAEGSKRQKEAFKGFIGRYPEVKDNG